MLAAVAIECGYNSDKGSLRGILGIKPLILSLRVEPFSVVLGDVQLGCGPITYQKSSQQDTQLWLFFDPRLSKSATASGNGCVL